MHFKSLLVPQPQLKLVNNFGNLNIIKLEFLCIPLPPQIQVHFNQQGGEEKTGDLRTTESAKRAANKINSMIRA